MFLIDMDKGMLVNRIDELEEAILWYVQNVGMSEGTDFLDYDNPTGNPEKLIVQLLDNRTDIVANWKKHKERRLKWNEFFTERKNEQ